MPSIEYLIWDGSESELESYYELLRKTYPSISLRYNSFMWKHLYNPEGPSIIAVAKSNGSVVAGRAFLRCYDGSTIFFQPCDTVTSTEFRRLGIFGKLTKLCMEHDGGLPKVNFPNNTSLPGYLKLGWTEKVVKGWSVKPSLVDFVNKQLSFADLESFLESNFPLRLSKFLLWRFSPNWGANYKFFKLTSKSLYVVNERRFGALITPKSSANKRMYAPTLSFGIELNEQPRSAIKRIVIPKMLKSPVRIATKGEWNSANSLIEIIGLMDTF